METTVAAGGTKHATTVAAPGALGLEIAGLPIPAWGAILSCASMIIGWNWDISWHRSIGRDTVWTLAHIAIYVALALAFLYNAGLVLSHTFGPLRAAPGVRILGFKGPSAAFITLWGLLLQFTAIVFDDWWHNTYGLDVDVFSPPHGLLTWGISVFYLGQFAVVALWRNNAPPEDEWKTRVVAVLIWGMFLGHISIAPDPMYGPMAVRTVFFVATTAMAFPFGLVFINAYLGRKDGAAWASLVCIGLGIALMQIFQLFPASPQFGPVFHRIPNFLPPPFPLLLVVPALALGWVLPGGTARFSLGRYLAASVVFLAVFTTTNWIMSGVILSPLGQNRFFGGGYPGNVFEQGFRAAQPLAADPAGALSVAIGIALGVFYSWAGHMGGRWLREVVR